MNESLSINNNIQSGSRNVPQFSPYRGCLLHGKSIPVLPWPNGTLVTLVGSILQVFKGFMIGLECESLAARYSLKRLKPHTTAIGS